MATILIVEDDRATCAGLAALLAGASYRVLTAHDVPCARDVLADQHPDLLITDIRLGDYNGLQLIAMAAETIPAIVLTGYPDASIEADARRLGATYLVKPIVPTALLAVVARMLGQMTLASTRQWPRHQLGRPVVARLDDEAVWIDNISQAGVGIKLRPHTALEWRSDRVLQVPPALVTVPVTLIWMRPHSGSTMMCGAAIQEAGLPTWRAVVQALTTTRAP
jgi:DNA-binding response OmpR family regulator